MSALSDTEINALLGARPSLCPAIPAGDARVKRGSLDLSVGKIYLPETAADALGGITKPRASISLNHGQTALIETAETINLPRDIVAIGFPPARETIKGLLMTNPGLVDPGYDGPLRCTVINMGRTPLALAPNQRIMRLVLLRLAVPPTGSGRLSSKAIDEELLAGLCQDFMSVEAKAVQAAQKVVDKAQIRGPAVLALMTLIVSVTTTLVTNYVTIGKSKDEIIATLTKQVNDLQADKIKQLQLYIDHLGDSHAAPAPPADGKGNR